MNRTTLHIAAMLLFVIASVMIGGTVTFSDRVALSKATNLNQDILTAYCRYNPDDPVFQAGRQDTYHPTTSPVMDTYIVLLPVVNAKFTRSRITLAKDDQVFIRACGCVQTGGKGKTWKRYVNPTGPNSDKLYHGVIALNNLIIVPPPGTNATCCASSPTIPGTLRISDMIAAQNRGFKFQASKETPLTLGYEDDDYTDNGYGSHDDGTEDQCRGVGGVAIEVTVRHKTN